MSGTPMIGESLPSPRQYVVVARRYRPQVFEELLGQEHVAKALSNAISTKRVGHAYLFTGARGVGKTSAARILSKALNCEQGPGPVPCNQCDVCRSISSGDDVDVLEIDGASNRGIDEIRQLRQNVNVRPSRARFKIYIIDEVHMLTREAFNALLKTLEEPPQHVKFLFCTTEPSKIPITILSRCQRFDFAGISARSIVMRLQQIVEAEGMSAEPEALEVLARRAAGSMRDGQSLLEQLLAFAAERITVADVHRMLGSAGDDRLRQLVVHLVEHNVAAALAELDTAVQEGVDVALLMEQLLGYARDCMVAAAGAPPETFLSVSVSGQQQVIDLARQWSLDTILAAMQILDQTLARMRYSTQGRILAELALVRIGNLQDLEELPALIAQLQDESGARTGKPASPREAPQSTGVPGGPSTPAPKKKADLSDAKHPPQDEPALARGVTALSAENAAEIWAQVVAGMNGMAAESARQFDQIAISAPNRLVIGFRPRYTLARTYCSQNAARFEQALSELAGEPIRVEFTELEESLEKAVTADPAQVVTPQQRLTEVSEHPMIRRASELFGAQPIRVDVPPAKS